jgi:hypothetical protein
MFVPGYSEQEAREAVAASFSYAEALRRLELCATGGNWRTLRARVARWEIPIDHFDPDIARRRALRQAPRPIEEIVVERSTYSRNHLEDRLYAAGLKQPICELCGQGELWRDRRMALILDHVNGVRDDNRLENLRIVCPNCAATFERYCGRKNRLECSDRPCLRCGAPFRPKYPRQRYCWRACGGGALRDPPAACPGPSSAASSARPTRSSCARSPRSGGRRSGAGTACPTTRSASGCASMSARPRAGHRDAGAARRPNPGVSRSGSACRPNPGVSRSGSACRPAPARLRRSSEPPGRACLRTSRRWRR